MFLLLTSRKNFLFFFESSQCKRVYLQDLHLKCLWKRTFFLIENEKKSYVNSFIGKYKNKNRLHYHFFLHLLRIASLAMFLI